MVKSENIGSLGNALVKFHTKMGKIKKDSSNPFFKSTYASLSNILEAIDEPLSSNGLSFVQFPTGAYGLTTMLLHADSGEFIQDTYEMKPAKDDPQGRGSCITYQRRYALAAILGLNIDADDDGNQASASSAGTVKKIAVDDGKPWLNIGTPQFKAITSRLTDKTTTIDEVKSHYKISTAVLEELKKYG